MNFHQKQVLVLSDCIELLQINVTITAVRVFTHSIEGKVIPTDQSQNFVIELTTDKEPNVLANTLNHKAMCI